VRIVTDLTGATIKDRGLNLTNQTRWGILNHTNRIWKLCLKKHQDNISNNSYCLLNHNYEECKKMEN
jgi:dGTP triphosphohydrolase